MELTRGEQNNEDTCQDSPCLSSMIIYQQQESIGKDCILKFLLFRPKLYKFRDRELFSIKSTLVINVVQLLTTSIRIILFCSPRAWASSTANLPYPGGRFRDNYFLHRWCMYVALAISTSLVSYKYSLNSYKKVYRLLLLYCAFHSGIDIASCHECSAI